MHAWGPTLAASYAQAALALYHYMCPDASGLAAPLQQTCTVAGSDLEELLVAWLDELLFRFQTPPYLVASRVRVESLSATIVDGREEYRLTANIQGDGYDRRLHRAGTEVKAITSSNLRIQSTRPTHDIYVIFDI